MMTYAQKQLVFMLANLDQMQARVEEARSDPKSSNFETELDQMRRLTQHMMVTVEQALGAPDS